MDPRRRAGGDKFTLQQKHKKTAKHFPGLSPLLDDDDHRSQKQNQDDEAADAGPEDQTHVLGMLGNLQRTFGVLTGGWKRR